MESNGNENISPPPMCRNGCGFWGNPSFDNLCSKCFKDLVKRKNTSPVSGRLSPMAAESTVSDKVDSMTASLAQANLDEPSPSHSASPTVTVASPDKCHSETAEEGAAGGTELDGKSDDNDGDKGRKPKKNRCLECRKKVGLTGFQCRCGGLFCSQHRYSDKHNCTFDYKEHGQEMIRKHNPIVVGPKIQKI